MQSSCSTLAPVEAAPAGHPARAAANSLAPQIDRLVALGVAERLGCSREPFRQALSRLEQHLPDGAGEPDIDQGHVNAVIVLNVPGLPAREALALINRGGKLPIESLYPRQPEDFRPTPEARPPAAGAYLLLGVDRGNSTLNAVPTDALQTLAASGRSPLTVEEGIAVLMQWPLFLQPNRCFMMLGSRCGDRRVPALWLSAGRPKLGWCWEGNPHTWLGFASCVRRSPGVPFDKC